MGFSQEAGYTPQSIEMILDDLRAKINVAAGTAYTRESFIGTNWYKYAYATAQRTQEGEIKTAEVFAKLQQYIKTTNERIQRPVNTNPGLIENLEKAGYTASLKKPIDADAGKVHICVDVDETSPTYAATKLAINKIISTSTVAGVVSQGAESSPITLKNGQTFDFKYTLPNRIEPRLRLTVTLSENNQVVIKPPDEVKLALLQNIAKHYRLGRNFEPQKYFGVVDAPWSSKVLLEWSTDAGATWNSTVRVSAYDDLFVIKLANIELVED